MCAIVAQRASVSSRMGATSSLETLATPGLSSFARILTIQKVSLPWFSKSVINIFVCIECLASPLTRDHKPDDPQESQVIIAAGGRIDSYRDSQGHKVGPERVWLKHEDIPGLAMSRSFGDQVAARVGVNAVPEVSEYHMSATDKVIILASDGVWEFLEN